MLCLAVCVTRSRLVGLSDFHEATCQQQKQVADLPRPIDFFVVWLVVLLTRSKTVGLSIVQEARVSSG